MPVRQQDCIELAALQLIRTTVLCLFLSSTLEHSTVDQDARVLCHNVISRAGDVTRRTVEMNFHRASLTSHRDTEAQRKPIRKGVFPSHVNFLIFSLCLWGQPVKTASAIQVIPAYRCRARVRTFV